MTGLRLKHCVIGSQEQRVDLADLTLDIPLELIDCAVPAVINLESAKTRRLSFKHCRMTAIRLSGARIRGDLLFDETCFPQHSGDCNDSTPSIEARGVTVQGRISLKNALTFSGAFFPRARIDGSFVCSGAFLASLEYTARTWTGPCLCDGLVNLDKSCDPNGCVRCTQWQTDQIREGYPSARQVLAGKFKGRSPNLPGTVHPEYRPGNRRYKALDLYGARIRGNVYLHKGFTSFGEVSFNSAKIRALHGNGCLFFQEGGVALSIDGIQVQSSVFLRNTAEERCLIYGTATFLRASVKHRLVCDGVTFFKPLVAADLGVDDPMRRRERYAFYGRGLRVGSDVVLNLNHDQALPTRDYPEIGRISFETAQIGGCLRIAGKVDGRSFSDPNLPFLNLEFARVTNEVTIVLDAAAHDVEVNAAEARFGTFDLSRCDPDKVTWNLEGLHYSSLRHYQDVPVSTGRRWWNTWIDSILAKKPAVQPYDQLIKFLREAGDERAAKRVAIARENRMTARHGDELLGQALSSLVERKRRLRWIRPPLAWSAGALEYIWRQLVRLFVGYGYRPARAFICLLVLVGLGAIIFHLAYQDTSPELFPTRAEYYTGGIGTHTIGAQTYKHAAARDQHSGDPKTCSGNGCNAPKNYPVFNPLFHSLELATPLPDLGQEAHWDIMGKGTYWTFLECISGCT